MPEDSDATYIIECQAPGIDWAHRGIITYYVGMVEQRTIDRWGLGEALKRRLYQHLGLTATGQPSKAKKRKGAKYTAGRMLLRMVYTTDYTESEAKRLSHGEREAAVGLCHWGGEGKAPAHGFSTLKKGSSYKKVDWHPFWHRCETCSGTGQYDCRDDTDREHEEDG